MRKDGSEGDDWDSTDLRIESLRNVALRDMGRYEEAVNHSSDLLKWHEKWVSLANVPLEQEQRNFLLASAFRKRARCLAYVGDENEAKNALNRAIQLPCDQPKANEKGKWHFGFGEILRHNRKYKEALAEYSAGLEIAQSEPDLDLYTWSCLCLSDAFFMLGRTEEARDTLALAKSAIALFGEELPVELTHIQFSEFALNLADKPNTVNDALTELVQGYQSRGVDWVELYVAALKRTRRPPFPKRF